MSHVTDNRAKSRYEMPVDGKIAFVAYRRDEGMIFLNHAEVPQELEGRGLGSELARATLEQVRSEGLKVVPRCGFIAAFIRRHPEYADLVAK